MVDSLEKYRVIIGYSEYLSYGLMKELIHRISEKEGKSFEEVLKEIGVNRETIREPWGKRRVLEKAFEVLDPSDVLLEVFYDIRGVYQRVIRDILEIADEEVRKEVLMECSFFDDFLKNKEKYYTMFKINNEDIIVRWKNADKG